MRYFKTQRILVEVTYTFTEKVDIDYDKDVFEDFIKPALECAPQLSEAELVDFLDSELTEEE